MPYPHLTPPTDITELVLLLSDANSYSSNFLSHLGENK